MALPLAAAVALGLSLLGPTGGAAQDAARPPPQPDPVDSLSPECRAPGAKLYTLAPLRRVKTAARDRETIKVLAVGSSSTAGAGSSSPAASYPARLEDELDKLFPDTDIEMTVRGLSGEVADDAADQFKDTVADVAPDVVVWQVGTSEAMARVGLDAFSDALDDAVKWLRSHNIDVVLVDPQYTASLAQDEHYSRIVRAIDEIARKNGVPLVHRYDATRAMAERNEAADPARDQFQLNDLGYRCMAEYVARAIVIGLRQAEAPAPGGPKAE